MNITSNIYAGYDDAGAPKSDFEKIYNKHSVAIKKYVSKSFEDPADVEDTCQEIWAKVNKNLPNYAANTDLAYNWLKKNSQSTILDIKKSADTRWSRGLVDIDTTDVHDDINFAESPGYDGIGLKTSLDLLNSRDREIVEMHYFGGYTQAEIAQITKRPVSTVKEIIQKAVKKFRDHYNEDINYYYGY
jgi:RNA polymerase sigma-70 factor (ECF subfamily)